ncbi:2727_t:CDS:1, partial [Dentiscutata heterogama]
KLPRINLENNPWNEPIEEFFDEPENLIENINEELYTNNQNKIIESRKAELNEDKKMFESLLTIVSDNIQNDSFYSTYQKLKQSLIAETIACQEALRAKHQQKTWHPPHRSKLAFWLQ